MAHLENMRYRKQPGTAAIYEDATVISGMSTGSSGTPYAGDHEPFQEDLGPEKSSSDYNYEKKDLDYAIDDKGAGLASGGAQVHVARFSMSRSQWAVLGLITLVAAYVRLWRLSNPHNVVFDEVHFGKFAGRYINGTYFFDVHPPLAKMMFAAVGKLAGYDGVFDFKSIGLDYLAAGVPYVGMRLMPALLGLAMVPITYIALSAIGHAPDACALAALLVAFENSLLTQSRLILLDSALIFFTGATIMFWALFHTEARRPFAKRWWVYLGMTGISLGNALSCKWVGLFLVATIGLSTLKDLWEKLGDLHISATEYARHFVARALGLIVVPLAVYAFWFQVHFKALHRSGEGNSFMSPEFQNTLDGVNLGHTPRDIYYGSRIRLRHDATNAGYLHSHMSNYETGSKQQQVTLYSFRDENNYWVITRTQADEDKLLNATEPRASALEPVKDGDVVRLTHWKTFRRLHSHDQRPPVSTNDYQNEVSGYGWEGFGGDSNDHWRVQILEGDPRVPGSTERLMSIYSKFRLVHVNQRCALYSNRKRLPKWAHEQIEVTCMKSAKFPKTLWRVETNVNENIPKDAALAEYRRPGLVAKVVEANKVMWRVNNGLTKSHPYESRPHTWPWMRRGMAFWGDKTRSIYMIGTPVVWWASLAAVAGYCALQVLLFLRDKRGFRDRLLGVRERYSENVGFFVVGWFLHWAPFFLMGRQLFLHHYLPALWFAICALAGTLDLFTRRTSRKLRQVVMGVVLLLAVRMYLQYSHLAYGTQWTRKGCENSKWLKSWDYDCRRFPDTSAPAAPSGTAASAASSGAPADSQPAVASVSAAGKISVEEASDPAALGDGRDHAAAVPPPAQNFDPLENENKLNEPAPQVDHERINSGASDADAHMRSAATTQKKPGDGSPGDEKSVDDHAEARHAEAVGDEGVHVEPPTIKKVIPPQV